MDENPLRQHSNMIGETGSILDVGNYEVDRSAGKFDVSDKRLVAFKRIRYTGWTRELPVWDLSYCHGILDNGSVVEIQFDDVSRPKVSARSARKAEAELHGLLARFVDQARGAAGAYGEMRGFVALSTMPD